MQYLSDSQAKQFLGSVRGYRLHAMFVLAIGSGMRQGELLGLQWGDVDWTAGP
jgi:integrase